MYCSLYCKSHRVETVCRMAPTPPPPTGNVYCLLWAHIYIRILHNWACTVISCISPGDVAGQFTAAPRTCPGDPITFTCTVTGDISGFTIWRVGGSSECPLIHASMSSSVCGADDTFTATSGIGFGTNGPSYTSTLSGTALISLNGTLVECFGPANNVDPGNRVSGSTLQIRGQ